MKQDTRDKWRQQLTHYSHIQYLLQRGLLRHYGRPFWRMWGTCVHVASHAMNVHRHSKFLHCVLPPGCAAGLSTAWSPGRGLGALVSVGALHQVPPIPNTSLPNNLHQDVWRGPAGAAAALPVGPAGLPRQRHRLEGLRAPALSCRLHRVEGRAVRPTQ